MKFEDQQRRINLGEFIPEAELVREPEPVEDRIVKVEEYEQEGAGLEEFLLSLIDYQDIVKAKTDHFSIYQPMGLAPMTAAQDEFYLRDFYAFPNPSRGNAAVNFRIQPGLADSVRMI